jgi:hypothetical protein
LLLIEELKERMVDEYDEISLLEILDIKAKDIVEAFHDKIVERYDALLIELDIEEQE